MREGSEMSRDYDACDGIRDIQIKLDTLLMEVVRLRHIEGRATEKLEQPETLPHDPTSGTSDAERAAYIQALKFVLQKGL